jgi:hypothetical protein
MVSFEIQFDCHITLHTKYCCVAFGTRFGSYFASQNIVLTDQIYRSRMKIVISLNHYKELNYVQVTTFQQRSQEETFDDREGKEDGEACEEA